MILTRTSLHPKILGQGRAGQAIQFALGILKELEPDLGIQNAEFLKRGEIPSAASRDLLCLAGPNALHARQIIEGCNADFRYILAEKPVCVSISELELLSKLESKIAILHVYRQMWGPKRIRDFVVSGEVGEILSVEGRYWHSSTAEAFVHQKVQKTSSWKNDPALCGPYDVLLDVGTHWLDMACFLIGAYPTQNQVWVSHKGSDKSHRDSQVFIQSNFASGARTFGSISKMAHGFSDEFEVHLIGTKKMLSWSFREPDQVVVGEGRRRSNYVRESSQIGSGLPPFRAMGWLEGYIEILRQFLFDISGKKFESYPDLPSVLPMMRSIFEADFRV